MVQALSNTEKNKNLYDVYIYIYIWVCVFSFIYKVYLKFHDQHISKFVFIWLQEQLSQPQPVVLSTCFGEI